MSHQAVRDFYQKLVQSDDMVKRYKVLTKGWFNYNPDKIIAFAAQAGFLFTIEDLKYVRLTNYFYKSAMTSCRICYKVDYEPTALPSSPESPFHFITTNGRTFG